MIIFILGHNRSGKTTLMKMITENNNIAYFEHYSNKLYKHPQLFRIIPLLFKYNRLRFGITKPRATEGMVWQRFFPNWCHLTENEVTSDMEIYYNKAIKWQLKAFGTSTFVNENPAHCLKIRWLNKMFPDARYIVMRRNKDSAVTELYEKLQRRKDQGFSKEHTMIDVFAQFGNNDLWQDCVDFYDYVDNFLKQDLPKVVDRTIQINYDDIVNEPEKQLKIISGFIGTPA